MSQEPRPVVERSFTTHDGVERFHRHWPGQHAAARDAGVFADLAVVDDDRVEDHLAAFDAALVLLAPSRSATAGTLRERAHGARRIVVRAAAVTAAQSATAVVAALTR